MTTADSSIMTSRFVDQAHIQRTLSSRQDAKNAKRLSPFFALLLGALCVCSRPRQSVTPRLAASSKCSDRAQLFQVRNFDLDSVPATWSRKLTIRHRLSGPAGPGSVEQ